MPQHVVQSVAAGRARHLGAVLQVVFDALQRAGVDQLAQLLLSQQLAQQVAVERQRGGAALGVGGVALVHVRGDVVEQQRGGKRRRALRLDLDERDLARGETAQQLLQAGHVEHVLEALPVGLEHDREVVVAARHLEQVLRLQSLLPQRRAPPRVGARDQQRARGVLAKARAEQRRAAELGGDGLLDLVGLEQHELGGRRQRLGVVGVEVGEVQHDAVVRGDRVGLETVTLADPRGQREPPGGVHAPAIRREHAQAPVADLVAEALEHDRALARQHARGRLLLAQVGEQVARGALVEVVVALERLDVLLDRPARERADRLAELDRASDGVALPERHGAGSARRGGDDHAVAADLLDPPGRCPEQEHLPRARLVDHLLVELADAAAVGERHGVEPAVGDRACVRDRELARSLARADRPRDAIPDDARAQLAELLGGIAPVEHVEHVLEQLA